MKNVNVIGEVGKTLGQHYVEAMEMKSEEVVVINEVPVNETPEVPAAPAEKPKAKKWFEEEGAFPYNEGDVVQIIAGKDLHLRKAVVVGPSAKKGALKAQLIHPVKNEPQKTQCSFDFDRLLLIESNGQEVNAPLAAMPGTEETSEAAAV